ncbi:MAG TPA: hypothetical protein VNS81_11260 [Nocardioides sp.]|nr:hypothetical protein [Nocardioides sp.]
MSGSFTGTRLLLGLGARRDRVLVPVWSAVLVLMSFASAAATGSLYDGEAARLQAAEAINGSPAIIALYGPIVDPRSAGELAMTKMTVLYALFAATLLVAVVRRHTRVEEESGRTELVGGTAVGRDAPLLAAVVEGVLVSLVLGLLVAVANVAGGLEVPGSVAFGAMWTGTCLVATGVAAVAVQVSASARTCASVAATALGTLFVLRAVGDTGPGWLSWLSPLGWNTQVRAYSDTRWWLLAAYPVLAVLLVLAAHLLRRRRDLGSGLLAARPGPAHGSPRLRDAVSLVLQLHGTAVVLWSVTVAVLGALFGSITPSLDGFLESAGGGTQDVLDALGGALVAAILSMIAVVIAYFAATVVSHAGRDEAEGRVELVLSTATSRARWFAATVLLAVLGTGWLLLLTGVGLWVGYVAADGPGIGNLVVASLAWAPAVWVVAALAALSLALRPGWTVLAWAWPAAFLTLGVLGDLLELPAWVPGLSPYSHVPQLPAEDWDWGAESGLTAVAVALLAVAWWRFRERDIG